MSGSELLSRSVARWAVGGVVVLVMASLVFWLNRSSAEDRVSLPVQTLTATELTEFTGAELAGGNSESGQYSYTVWGLEEPAGWMAVEFVYADGELPDGVPAPPVVDGDGRVTSRAGVSRDGDADLVVSGSDRPSAMLDFVVECIRVVVSGEGFDPGTDGTGRLEQVLRDRLMTPLAQYAPTESNMPRSAVQAACSS